SPGAAIADKRLLDSRVRVEHLPAAALVQAAVDVATEVRQHREPQVLILQVQGAPRDWLTSIGQCITNRIGIVESSVGKQIERWIWICRPFRVGRNLQSSLPDANGRIRRGGYACQ